MKAKRIAILGVGLCLVAAVAMAQGFNFRRNDAFNAGASVVTALFRLLPTGGAGAGTINDDLCTTYASELVGNYFCLRGDGTQSSVATLTATGSPTSATETVCPSGTGCATPSVVRLNGTSQGYTTSSVSTPTGDFSFWATVRVEPSPGAYSESQRILAQGAGGPGSTSFEVMVSGSSSYAWSFRMYGPTQVQSTTASNSGSMDGRWLFISGTYQRGATNGTSVLRLYTNGIETAVTTNREHVQALSTAFGVGRYGASSGWLSGSIRGAGFTEKVLSAATIQAMSEAVLPSLKGSQNEALTFARNSTAYCEASDGSLTNLTAHRPCWTSKGLAVRSAVTNSLLRSAEIDNAAWNQNGTTVTAGAATCNPAPDGTMTADLVVCSAPPCGIGQAPAALGASTPVISGWIRKPDGGSGTPSMFFYSQNGVASNTIAPSSSWQRFTFAGANTTNKGWFLGFASSWTAPDGDLCVWGAQLQDGATTVARYVPTAGTAATSNAEDVSVPNPISTGSAFCLAATAEPETTWVSGNNGLFSLGASAPNYLQGWYSNTGDPKFRVYDAASVEKRLSLTMTPANSFEFMACSTAGGVFTGYRDGVIDTGSTTGAGTGIITTQPNTLYLGLGVSQYLNGYLKDFCVSTTPEVCL